MLKIIKSLKNPPSPNGKLDPSYAFFIHKGSYSGKSQRIFSQYENIMNRQKGTKWYWAWKCIGNCLLPDNVRRAAFRAKTLLEKIQVGSHFPYRKDLARSKLHLFHYLKIYFAEKNLHKNHDIKIEMWFLNKEENFYDNRIKKGAYIKKYRYCRPHNNISIKSYIRRFHLLHSNKKYP